MLGGVRRIRNGTIGLGVVLLACRRMPPPQASRARDFSYCAVTADSVCILWEPTVGQLISRPEVYDGKRVRTIGFLHLEFEGNGLFASAEEAEHVYLGGIWVVVPDSFASKASSVNDQYVILEGVYHGGPGGHMGASKGRLDSIVRLDRWPGRTELRTRR
jgi:hypothetical protein